MKYSSILPPITSILCKHIAILTSLLTVRFPSNRKNQIGRGLCLLHLFISIPEYREIGRRNSMLFRFRRRKSLLWTEKKNSLLP